MSITVGTQPSNTEREVFPSSHQPLLKRASDDAIGGAFAGLVARIITAPFDVIKIRFQLQTDAARKYKSMRHAFRTVIKEEGFFSLWKGNLSATYLWISYAMVQFSVYGIIKQICERIPDPFYWEKTNVYQSPLPTTKTPFKKIRDGDVSSSVGHDLRNSTLLNDGEKVKQSKFWNGLMLFAAGAGAGMVATAVTYPFDIMRTQFAMQGQQRVYHSLSQFVFYTARSKGIAGFYAGLSPAVVGVAPYMGLSFAFYESMKRLVDPPLDSSGGYKRGNSEYKDVKQQSTVWNDGTIASLFKKAFCGGVSGGLAKFSVYPLDTVKKRLQAQVLRNTVTTHAPSFHYNSIVHCCRSIYLQEGIKGFYRGLVPTTFKAVSATAITFAAFEGAKEFLAASRIEGKKQSR